MDYYENNRCLINVNITINICYTHMKFKFDNTIHIIKLFYIYCQTGAGNAIILSWEFNYRFFVDPNG